MSEWQPIETAPKDGTPILVCVAGPDYYASQVHWSEDLWTWVYPCGQHGPEVFTLTHWMPLPEPPK